MKKTSHMLLSREPMSEIIMGNHALVRAMVETGTLVIASYPGSPTPEIADAIASIPPETRPFYFQFSTNEKVATEVAYGAAINGHLSCVFFKSVGLNVAADTFVQLGHMNIIGGMVVVLGDDPGANSSQNEQDNRHYAHLSYTPVLEPASPSEVYSFYREAVSLSVQYHMPVILRLTTHVCHAKERVAFGAWSGAVPDRTPRFDRANGPYIPIAALVHPMKRRARQNLSLAGEEAEKSPLNLVIPGTTKKMGVITMGLPFLSLMDTLELCSERPGILKLGFVHPVPRRAVEAFLKDHEEVLVLEELDDIVEKEVKAIAWDSGARTAIKGKMDAEDFIGEYTPEKVEGIVRRTWPRIFREGPLKREPGVTTPARPAQLCPGCGHRSAFRAVKRALDPSTITVADIGCHTLGFLPPYEIGEMLMCMGASPGIGAGLSLFNSERKVVIFLGDSTFFHAGLPGIINLIFNKHNVTLVLMENGTTAMTGHQDHPGTGRNFNDATERISVRSLLEGLGVRHISEADTYKQEELAGLIRESLAIDGFSVVIARHPCMLKFTREQKAKKGYRRGFVEIDPGRCEKIHECLERFGCPSFRRHDGGAVTVNRDLCIGDGSCMQTCPASAIVRSAD